MAVRGERILAAALAAAGRRRFRNRIAGQAARYWSAPTGSAWEANSHWRNGIGDQAWLEVGDDHWKIYETFARALNSPSPNTVMEWAPAAGKRRGFRPHAQRFIAADISQENLDECVRQVRATCTTPVETRRIDLACPEQATVGLAGSCDVFLCLYVIELTTGANAVRAILKIARTVLAPEARRWSKSSTTPAIVGPAASPGQPTTEISHRPPPSPSKSFGTWRQSAASPHG